MKCVAAGVSRELKKKIVRSVIPERKKKKINEPNRKKDELECFHYPQRIVSDHVVPLIDVNADL